MDFDFTLGGNTFVHEELGYGLSMFTLKLNDAAPSWVFNHGTIAIPQFFEVSIDLLKVKIIGQSLDNCDALSSGSLLELNMNHLFLTLLLVLICFTTSNNIQLIFDSVGLDNIEVTVHLLRLN